MLLLDELLHCMGQANRGPGAMPPLFRDKNFYYTRFIAMDNIDSYDMHCL